MFEAWTLEDLRGSRKVSGKYIGNHNRAAVCLRGEAMPEDTSVCAPLCVGLTADPERAGEQNLTVLV